ncbi:MAG: hypothetical protein HY696_09475 [Deltaproteobacteria bacterium]|nr:hypothetical protein [Deltaproteobacteria bacterium]
MTSSPGTFACTAASPGWLYRLRLAQAVALLPAAIAALVDLPDVARHFIQLQRLLTAQRKAGTPLRLDYHDHGLDSADRGLRWHATVSVTQETTPTHIQYRLQITRAAKTAAPPLTPGDLLFLWWLATHSAATDEAVLRDTDFSAPSCDAATVEVFRRLHDLGAPTRLGAGETAAERTAAVNELAAQSVPSGFAAIWERAGYDAGARRALTQAITQYGIRCRFQPLDTALAAELPPTTVDCVRVLGPVPSRPNYVVTWALHPALGDSLTRTELALLVAQALPLHTVGLTQRAPDGWIEHRVELAMATDLLPPHMLRIDTDGHVVATGKWPGTWQQVLAHAYSWFARLWAEVRHPAILQNQRSDMSSAHFGPVLQALPASVTQGDMVRRFWHPLLDTAPTGITIHRVAPSAADRVPGGDRVFGSRAVRIARTPGQLHVYLPRDTEVTTWTPFEWLGLYPGPQSPGFHMSGVHAPFDANLLALLRLLYDDAHAARLPSTPPGKPLRVDLVGTAARTLGPGLLEGLATLQAQLAARDSAKLPHFIQWLATHPQFRIEAAPTSQRGPIITAFPAEGRVLILVENDRPPNVQAWSLLIAAMAYALSSQPAIRVACYESWPHLEGAPPELIMEELLAWWQRLTDDGTTRRSGLSRGPMNDPTLCPAWSRLTAEGRRAYQAALQWFATHRSQVPTGLWPHPVETAALTDEKFDTFVRQFHDHAGRGLPAPPFPYPEALAHYKVIRAVHRKGAVA